MAEEKLVSIILINWNSYGLTSRCIENIRKNTDYPNYEVWVVDNGSRDGSFEGLKRDFPFLKTIKNERNMGFAYALNEGYRDAKGEYLCHVNSDAIVQKGWLTELVKVLESSNDISTAGAREISEEQARNPGGLEMIRNEKNIEKMTLPVCWVVRKEMVGKIGYLDAEYFSPAYGEESDWNFRAHNQGYRIVRVNKANVVHIGSAVIRKNLGDGKYTVLINYHRLRSMLFNLSISDLLRFVPGMGLILVNSLLTGSIFQVLKAYWLNVKDWKLIMQQRKAKRGYVPFKEPKFAVVG